METPNLLDVTPRRVYPGGVVYVCAECPQQALPDYRMLSFGVAPAIGGSDYSEGPRFHGGVAKGTVLISPAAEPGTYTITGHGLLRTKASLRCPRAGIASDLHWPP